MFLLMMGCFPDLEPPDSLEGVPWRDYDDDGIALQDDCDDEDAAVHPMAVEVANGIDDDCDGDVDEGWDTGCPDTLWYYDVDGDGWGDDEDTVVSCEKPMHAVATGGDCGPDDPFVSPDAIEICGDDIDQNCTPGDCGAWANDLADAALTLEGADGRRLGSSVLVGDVNEDGALDLVAGAGGDSTSGQYGGAVFQWLAVDVAGGQMGQVTAAYPPRTRRPRSAAACCSRTSTGSRASTWWSAPGAGTTATAPSICCRARPSRRSSQAARPGRPSGAPSQPATSTTSAPPTCSWARIPWTTPTTMRGLRTCTTALYRPRTLRS